MKRTAIVLIMSALPAFATPAFAQFIDIKTVPIATGEQFLIYPSRNLGFGGLSLAIRDPLSDPFANPAKGSRLAGSRLFGAPTFYDISAEGGAGRTLPAGGLFHSASGFGGLVLTLQQLVPARQPRRLFFISPVDSRSFVPPSPDALSRSHINQYAFGMIGRRLGERVSLGASASYGALDGMDGVELLYPNAISIDQSGSVSDLRLGITSETPSGRTLEAVALFSAVDMRHDVGSFDLIWDTLTSRPRERTRLERNRDRTNTYGLHLAAQGAPGTGGWRRAASFTANYKQHPQIPNYELMAIPRDPGYSYAYNLGMGIGSERGPAIVGVEVALEPIWSRTWAAADRATPATGGRTLQRGDRTVENAFVFRNAHLRAGVQRGVDIGPAASGQKLDLQVGLALRSIRYRLQQDDYVRNTTRLQREDWLEWSPTWGLTLRFPDLDIRYVGRQTNGTGRPGVAGPFGGSPEILAARAGGDVLLAPSGALTLAGARVRTHQVAVSVPLP